MTVLWCGGEDVDFPVNTPVVTTNATYYRSGYARCAIRATGDGSNFLSKSVPFSGGAVTSAWMTWREHFVNNSTAATRYVGFGLAGTNKCLMMGSASTNASRLALWKYDGTTATELAAETGTSIPSGVVTKMDLHVASYGASATVDLYINGALTVTFTGDVTVSGMSNFDSVFVGNNSYQLGVSEIVVSDADTRLLSLVSLGPSAAGDANAWTGAYTDIDDVTTVDADVVYTDTAAQDVQVNLSNLPAGTFAVRAVKLSARAAKSLGATATTVALGVKTGGTLNAGDAQAAATAWGSFERLMTTNPVTASAWTAAEVDALQLNLRSGS